MQSNYEWALEDVDRPRADYRRTFLLLLLNLLLISGLGVIAILQETDLAPEKAVAVWIAAVAAPARIWPTPADYIELQRLGCWDGCPMYRVRITGGGDVTSSGERFVCAQPPPATRVSRDAVARLFAGLRAVEFARMPNYTRVDVTDHETVAVVAVRAGLEHEVRHYLGDRGAPGALARMERRIDALAGTAHWIGTLQRDPQGNLTLRCPDAG